MLEKVKYIVAVASGKGGVGKSTTAVNTALALHSMGKSVGLLDADIYGPSIGMMLDVPEDQRPDVVDEKFFMPVMAKGLATMSMAYLTTDKTPMVWRGPMAAGALQQMLQQTQWGELDVLVIDMPPGTGDIQLTLSQKAQISGAIIVTTPQDIALLDAKKGIEMFLKVKIPVIGIIENMAIFSIMPITGIFTLRNISMPFFASSRAISCGVVTIIAPEICAFCDKVSWISPVPGGISITSTSNSPHWVCCSIC